MTRDPKKTYIGYSETSEGPIPHAEIVHDGGILRAPVKVLIGQGGVVLPVRRNGKLVYVLPGGADVA